MINKQGASNNDEPFSILLLGTQMAVGGSQQGLLDQARWFNLQGCKVAVAFFYDKEGLRQQWAEAADFPIHDLQSHQRGSGLLAQTGHLLGGLWRLWKLLKKGNFDVVETFTHDSNLLGLPIAWLAGIPVRIATHRGEIGNFPKGREKLHSWLINTGIVQTLVAVSERTRDKAVSEGVKPGKVSVILSGIKSPDASTIDRNETRRELGLDSMDTFLLAIGRLVFQKGHDVFIQAMPRIVKSFPNAKVGICGDGPLRPQLQSQIEDLGLASHIKLLGMRADVARLLAAADIFIQPSRWEGLSRALLEAMASGIPAVATNVDGTQEVIAHGIHGILTASEDPDALARSIMHLLENPELRKRMGVAARKHILQNYTMDEMCRKYYELMIGFLDNE